jgi:REP element-mobilizing transposase RayT
MPFRLYALITWTTRARADLLDQQGGRFLERFLPTIAARNGAEILACGIVADHVHVLIRLGPVVDIPRLVQGLKGASARIANRDQVMRRRLRWANGYDLRSVSPQGLKAVRAYLANQAEHHPGRVLRERLPVRDGGRIPP